MSWTNKIELDRDKREIFNSGSKNKLHEYSAEKT